MLCSYLHDAEQRATKKVITTQGYDLGIICPSLVRHIVIGGHKKGRIVKTIPEGKSYQIISYDADGKPIAFRSGNKFGIQNAYFFFQYGEFIWAADMNEKGSMPYSRLHRIRYDAQGRILSFYTIEKTFLFGEEYAYAESKPIECLYYNYVPNRFHTSKDVPAGYEGSPMRLYRYLIYEDKIDGYEKTGEQFVFTKTFKRKKTKSTVSPEVQFVRQLDRFLRNAEMSENSGVYFELHEGNDDMYRIYVDITPKFDAENDDWACNAETVLGEINITKHSDMEWEEIQDTAENLIRSYLVKGSFKDKLLSCAGIGTGFAEGDLILISRQAQV